MESPVYLGAILTGLAGLLTIDHRWRLAYFSDRRATLLTVLFGVLFFSVWDLLGIGLGIFYTGQTRLLTGISLVPNFPVEELFFLALLSYNALVVWAGAKKLWPRT